MPTAAPLDLVASIRGRRALVTGGSVGIGRNCVESLLAHVTGFGHQHPIARLPQARQRPADGEEVGGGVSPQAHLVGGCANQLRGRLVGLRSQLEAVLRPGEDFPSLEKAERM